MYLYTYIHRAHWGRQEVGGPAGRSLVSKFGFTSCYSIYTNVEVPGSSCQQQAPGVPKAPSVSRLCPCPNSIPFHSIPIPTESYSYIYQTTTGILYSSSFFKTTNKAGGGWRHPLTPPARASRTVSHYFWPLQNWRRHTGPHYPRGG